MTTILRWLARGTAALVLAGILSTPAATQEPVVVVANMADNTATVIDVNTATTLATLPTGEGPHEAAVSRNGRLAVVSNYGGRGAPGNTLTVIDLDALAVARTVDLGEHLRPHGLLFTTDERVAVTSETSQAVLLVDVVEGTVVAIVPTGQQASHMLTMMSGGTAILTANVVEGSISRLTLQGEPDILEVAPMVEAIAVHPGGERVWVGSNQERTVSVVRLPGGEIVRTLSGFGLPYRIAWTPDGTRALISDPLRSELRVVDGDTFNYETVEFNADGALDSAEFEDSAAPEGIAISRDGALAYVTLQGLNRVAEVDLVALEVTRTFETGNWPDGIAWGVRR